MSDLHITCLMNCLFSSCIPSTSHQHPQCTHHRATHQILLNVKSHTPLLRLLLPQWCLIMLRISSRPLTTPLCCGPSWAQSSQSSPCHNSPSHLFCLSTPFTFLHTPSTHLLQGLCACCTSTQNALSQASKCLTLVLQSHLNSVLHPWRGFPQLPLHPQRCFGGGFVLFI